MEATVVDTLTASAPESPAASSPESLTASETMPLPESFTTNTTPEITAAITIESDDDASIADIDDSFTAESVIPWITPESTIMSPTDSLSPLAIAGIVAGAIAVVAGGVAITVKLCKRKRPSSTQFTDSEDEFGDCVMVVEAAIGAEV
jgi:hypothetical protein